MLQITGSDDDDDDDFDGTVPTTTAPPPTTAPLLSLLLSGRTSNILIAIQVLFFTQCHLGDESSAGRNSTSSAVPQLSPSTSGSTQLPELDSGAGSFPLQDDNGNSPLQDGAGNSILQDAGNSQFQDPLQGVVNSPLQDSQSPQGGSSEVLQVCPRMFQHMQEFILCILGAETSGPVG